MAKKHADRRRAMARNWNRVADRQERLTLQAQKPFWQHVLQTVMGRVQRIGTVGFPVDEIFAIGEFRDDFNQILRPQWTRSLWTGISFEREWITSAEVDQSARLIVIQRNEDELPSIRVELSDEMRKAVDNWLETRSVGLWNKVGATVRANLTTVIRKAVDDGDSFDVMQAKIKSTLDGYSDYGARRIARTETTGAMQHGKHLEREEFGGLDKEWISRMDAKTRGGGAGDQFDHISADGQIVANDAPFIVSGQELIYPGDGSRGASAGNIIQCRCSAAAAIDTSRKKGRSKRPQPAAGAGPEKRKLTPQEQLLEAARKERDAPETIENVKQIRRELRDLHDELEEVRERVLALDNKIKELDQKIRDGIGATQENDRRAKELLLNGGKEDDAEFVKLRKENKKLWKELKEKQRERERRQGKLRSEAWKALAPPDPQKDLQVTPVSGANLSKKTLKSVDDATAWYRQVLSKTHNGQRIDVHDVTDTQEKRAYMVGGKIYLLKSETPGNVIHEIAHCLEHWNAKTLQAAKGFLYHRVGKTEPFVFQDRWPNLDFDDDEVGWDDEFSRSMGATSAAYTGKYYRTGTEILSSGMERLFANPVTFARQDPEFFRFIVGVLRGSFL